ncbi:SUKH-4 family immunity protein [Streptomyces sp. NPDC048639]|uniref:SUKH-4 family immunity protein n=1 Tax=Streptomyces sp. NPDC048639 TaxID=3365581 RepID=UPI0037135B56
MTEVPAEFPGTKIAALVRDWWREHRPGANTAYVVAPPGTDGEPVLGEIHRCIEGSVLLDASGFTAEEVHRQALLHLGVELGEGEWDDWPYALDNLAEDRLLVIVNVHRAGATRRSHEPERLMSRSVTALARSKVAVLAHVTPHELSDDGARAGVVFRLPTPDATRTVESAALHALALAEPRVVPMQAWSELVIGLTGQSVTEGGLNALLQDHPDTLVSSPNGISFVDDALADALRRETDADELRQVNRHMVRWLGGLESDIRNPDGWAHSGPLGRYAATGLAMHAVQAGTFEELLRDGGALANIPQTVLMDAAHCALEDGIPGNSAAADGIYLWSYGVTPSRQSEWASWLHLMASARNDHIFASAVRESGVHLPWQVKWTHWRPPGGYHVSYLRTQMIDELVEVRWRGRPAVAGLRHSRSQTTIWDAETGELLAGPWLGETIPEDHHAELAWPTSSGHDSLGPRTFRELRADPPIGRGVHPYILPSPALTVGDLVVLGGPGGLFAIESTTLDSISGLASPGLEPLTGSFAPAGEICPVDADPPSPADLLELYGDEEIVELEPDEVPDGLSHEPTRRLLLEFGLPDLHEGGMGIYPYGDHRMDVLDEMPWPDDIDPVAESGPFFQIGFWMGGELVIDGSTGHVLRVPTEPDQEHLAGLPAATSLEKFLTMIALWVTGMRTRETIVGSDHEASLLPQHVLVALLHVDRRCGLAPAWSHIFYNE